MKLPKRAEQTSDRAKLVATFVDVGPLFTLLSNIDHQVLYGRRGTGKTHAFSYLAETRRERGDIAVYIDMRTIGSTGGLYNDASLPISHRATGLLIDSVKAIYTGLYEFFVDLAEELDLSRTGPLLDRLSDAITEIAVIGTVQRENKMLDSIDTSDKSKAEASLSEKGLKVSYGETTEQKQKNQVEQRITESGVAEHRVHFGALGQVFNDIADAMGNKRLWVLLDEWSSVPLELQPYLADLLKRSMFPVAKITVKIAAIEQRSRFRLITGHGDYIGVELGADISADLNLDDYMVFDNDEERAKDFFQELLFKHYRETDELELASGPQYSDELIRHAFTQRNVFDEFVRATEGVPRDAINIISHAAQKALNDRISMAHINTAARNWYQRDKDAAIKANEDAHDLLHWIVDKVIGERRARAFLLRSNIDNELINTLFDARLLHIMKRNISARDQPGIRYDVYELDYGCYVDLKGTDRAPLGLLQSGDEDETSYIEVPPDDYRAIRRAILNLDEFVGRTRTLDI